jgi:nitrite reductase (NO-forming)
MSGLNLDAMSGLDRPARKRAHRSVVAIAAIIGSSVALFGCAGAKAANNSALQVNLGRYLLEPALLQAPAGNLDLRVTNVDPEMVHDLVVDGKGTRPLPPGQSQVLHIPNVAPGEYRMWCDMPGHAAAGQTGSLLVKAVTESRSASA